MLEIRCFFNAVFERKITKAVAASSTFLKLKTFPNVQQTSICASH